MLLQLYMYILCIAIINGLIHVMCEDTKLKYVGIYYIHVVVSTNVELFKYNGSFKK